MNMNATATRWSNPLVFKGNANWIGTESKMDEATMSSYANWSRSYMQAMYNLNITGQPHPDMNKLPNQYDPEICKGTYAPSDAEQMNIIMIAINWGRMAIFVDMDCGKTFMGGYAAMWWKKYFL